jgi:hypothetical protein
MTEFPALPPIQPGLPSLPPLPIDAPQPSRGVQFNAPPAAIFRDAMEQIDVALAGFEPGQGAIIGISTDAGWNAAVAAKTKIGVEIYAWIGEKWGEKLNYGVVVRKKFTLPF